MTRALASRFPGPTVTRAARPGSRNGRAGGAGTLPRSASCESRGGHASRARWLSSFAFSLIELIIAMSILAVGLVGAMRVFPVGLRASRRAEINSRAAITAQRTIESLKLKLWDELIEQETTTEEEGFQVNVRITRPSLEALVDPTRLKAIEVTVQYPQEGRPRELRFITYVRRPS